MTDDKPVIGHAAFHAYQFDKTEYIELTPLPHHAALAEKDAEIAGLREMVYAKENFPNMFKQQNHLVCDDKELRSALRDMAGRLKRVLPEISVCCAPEILEEVRETLAKHAHLIGDST